MALKPSSIAMTLKDYWERALPVRNSVKNFAKNSEKVFKVKEPAEPTEKAVSALSVKEPNKNSSKDHSWIHQLIEEKSAKYNIPKDLIHSIVQAESAYNPKAVSPVGAQGLMQLMPATARELGVTNAFDPAQNIEGGVKYFRQMMDRFGNDVAKSLAAYNAGPGAVAKYQGVPPYRETQNYVQKILKKFTDHA